MPSRRKAAPLTQLSPALSSGDRLRQGSFVRSSASLLEKRWEICGGHKGMRGRRRRTNMGRRPRETDDPFACVRRHESALTGALFFCKLDAVRDGDACVDWHKLHDEQERVASKTVFLADIVANRSP
ncbi:hypothetical protein FALCPG4_19077 [Fusarium falciforme]